MMMPSLDLLGFQDLTPRCQHAQNDLERYSFLFNWIYRLTPGLTGGCNDGSHRDPEQADGHGGAAV
jgi:hypothetical protein